MRRFLPILIVLIALGVAGGGGWWLYKKYYPSPAQQASAPVKISKQSAANFADLDQTSLQLLVSYQSEKQQLDSLDAKNPQDIQTLKSIVSRPLD